MHRYPLGSLLLSGIGTISKGRLPQSQELVLLEVFLWTAFLLHTSSEDRPGGSHAVRAGLVWRGSCNVLRYWVKKYCYLIAYHTGRRTSPKA